MARAAAEAEAARPFVPPRLPIPENDLTALQFFRSARINALQLWPRSAYERDFEAKKFFGRFRALVNAPDAIHRVLVDNHANYQRSPASIRILHPIAGNGLLLSEGDAWRLQRRTIAPALAPRIIPVLARHIATATAEAVAALKAASTPVDLLAAMQSLALEIAGRSMFSMQMNVQGAEMRAMLEHYALHHAQPYLLDLLLPARFIAPRDFGRRRFRRRWTGFMDRLIAERLATPPAADGPRDLLDMLRTARDPDTGDGFSPDALRDQVATMIVAGQETTAMTLFWALTLLAGAPAVQAQVAAEVRAMDLGPEGAAASLAHLVVTRAVVSETLRLYPPAPIMARQAIGADRLGELTVPAGGLVLIAPWVLHHHRKLWREPDAFDPSRFLPGAPPPPRFSYLPFGAGPRVCVGAQFALAESCLVLAAMIQMFHVEQISAAPVLPVAVVTLRPDHAPAFRLTPRAN